MTAHPYGGPDRGAVAADTSAAAWFGLPDDASERDVEVAHRAVQDFLRSAPEPVQPWARRQRAAADAAFERSSAWDGEADDGVPSPEHHRGAAEPEAAEPGAASGSPSPRRRLRLHPAVLVLLVAAVVFGVYRLGAPGAAPGDAPADAAPTGSASQAAVAVDETRVNDLKAKVAANPADLASLRALGQEYYRAADYVNAAQWQRKIVDQAPNDLDARLALGVALFNTGDLAGAETHWLRAATIAPAKAEVYYDLGFLYLSKSPPEIAKAEQAWGRVGKLAPGSALAKTVSAHLARLGRTTSAPSRSAP